MRKNFFVKTALTIAGILLIILGLLFFLAISANNDPEIEGESARVSLATWFVPLIPIGIGILFFIFSSRFRRKTKD